LIVTPDGPESLPRTMQSLGVRYVPFYNTKYKRIGTLWNGRYRGIHLENETYWLTCLRYVEQNPVRAGMVSAPADIGGRAMPLTRLAIGQPGCVLIPHTRH
jgi:putative transposase